MWSFGLVIGMSVISNVAAEEYEAYDEVDGNEAAENVPLPAPAPVVTAPPPPTPPAPTQEPTPAPVAVVASEASVEPAPSPPEETAASGIRSEFIFGSYGRVRAAGDLQGGSARQVNVVTHGSRIDEASYAELEFRQRFFTSDDNPWQFRSEIVATLAFLDDLFHYQGDFDQSMAMRNLYADLGWGEDRFDVSLWGGSRMYRGDDIYLLDFWPLDNLNTVGGGAAFGLNQDAGRTELKLHAGLNRLRDPYQYQVIRVPGLQFGADEIVYLDRQRFIASARAEQQLHLAPGARQGLKFVLYGESHRLPEGSRRDDDGFSEELLPEDSGWRVGGQVGFWHGNGGVFHGSSANLFLRYSGDLGAYGDMGIPYGVNLEETAQGARDLLIALTGNLETPWAGLLLGTYYRNFNTASERRDFNDYWETIVAARAHAYLTDHIHPGVEVSYQIRQHGGPYPLNESYQNDAYQVPAVTKLSLIQAFSLEPRMYSRPQLRLMYTAALPNASTRALYRPGDRRRDLEIQHYLGVGVEWWFNSASY
jgi:maltoporin